MSGSAIRSTKVGIRWVRWVVVGIWERFKRVRMESCLQMDVVLEDESRGTRMGMMPESTSIGLLA